MIDDVFVAVVGVVVDSLGAPPLLYDILVVQDSSTCANVFVTSACIDIQERILL